MTTLGSIFFLVSKLMFIVFPLWIVYRGVIFNMYKWLAPANVNRGKLYETWHIDTAFIIMLIALGGAFMFAVAGGVANTFLKPNIFSY